MCSAGKTIVILFIHDKSYRRLEIKFVGLYLHIKLCDNSRFNQGPCFNQEYLTEKLTVWI